MNDESKFFFIVLIMAFVIQALVFLSGCAKIQPVYIPQKCQATMPSPPLHTQDYLQNLKNMAIYTQELECSLDYCINGSYTLSPCAPQ